MLHLWQDRVLMYHGTPARYAGMLERQLRLVSLAFRVVPLEEIANGRKRTGGPRVALTFDDGLRSNVEIAYPILRKLGLTATFFVCPELVDRGAWLWNQEARERLKTLSQPARGELATLVGGPPEVEAWVEWMKTLRLAARQRVEEAIRAATSAFKPSGEQHAEFDLASWEELERVDPRVVTVGSHTMTHPILTSLNAEETESETRESRMVLEKRLERPVTLFCYPNGDLNDTVLQCARRYYRSAVTVAPGIIDGNTDPHLLPRYAVRPQRTRRLVRHMVLGWPRKALAEFRNKSFTPA
ncbi:MAG: polysaccharide deacetylase family protein [Burkholderiales bacterium]